MFWQKYILNETQQIPGALSRLRCYLEEKRNDSNNEAHTHSAYNIMNAICTWQNDLSYGH